MNILLDWDLVCWWTVYLALSPQIELFQKNPGAVKWLFYCEFNLWWGGKAMTISFVLIKCMSQNKFSPSLGLVYKGKKNKMDFTNRSVN